MILEQGLSNLHSGDGEDSDDALGMLFSAMSTLHHERLSFYVFTFFSLSPS